MSWAWRLAIVLVAVFAPAAQAAKPRADLRVTKVSLSSRALLAGEQLTVRWTVANAGRATAAKSTTQLVLSTDARLDRADLRLGSRSQKALRARKRASGRLSVRLAAPARRYSLLVCADARGKVRERSERNNCRAAAVEIGRAHV